MKKRTPISEIMTTKLVTINYDDDILVADMLFKSHNIRHIPVMRNDLLVGIISYTDLQRISYVEAVNEASNEVDTKVYNLFTIDQVMVKNVETVTPQTTIREVAEILSDKEFHALPVTEGNVLKGIVTTTDLMKYLLAQL